MMQKVISTLAASLLITGSLVSGALADESQSSANSAATNTPMSCPADQRIRKVLDNVVLSVDKQDVRSGDVVTFTAKVKEGGEIPFESLYITAYPEATGAPLTSFALHTDSKITTQVWRVLDSTPKGRLSFKVDSSCGEVELFNIFVADSRLMFPSDELFAITDYVPNLSSNDEWFNFVEISPKSVEVAAGTTVDFTLSHKPGHESEYGYVELDLVPDGKEYLDEAEIDRRYYELRPHHNGVIGIFADNEPGKYRLNIPGEAGIIDSAVITILPAEKKAEVHASPRKLPVGEVLDVAATGFSPSEEVRFVIDPDGRASSVPVATVKADEYGTAHISWRVPGDFVIGRHTVVASGSTSGSLGRDTFAVYPPESVDTPKDDETQSEHESLYMFPISGARHPISGARQGKTFTTGDTVTVTVTKPDSGKVYRGKFDIVLHLPGRGDEAGKVIENPREVVRSGPFTFAGDGVMTISLVIPQVISNLREDDRHLFVDLMPEGADWSLQQRLIPFAVGGVAPDSDQGQSAQSGDAEVLPEAAIVAPALALAQAGDQQTFVASGFDAGEDVSFVVHSEPVTVGTVKANSAGVASISWLVPTDFEVGDHTVIATGKTSGKVAKSRFTVQTQNPVEDVQSLPVPPKTDQVKPDVTVPQKNGDKSTVATKTSAKSSVKGKSLAQTGATDVVALTALLGVAGGVMLVARRRQA